MNVRLLLYLSIFFSLIINFPKEVLACEVCTVPRLGRDEGAKTESNDKKWFFKYMFEEQNWHEKEGGEAHRLHHAGHHFHDKTREQFHHLTLGNRLAKQITVFAEIPYVIRHSIEVDNHAILGTDQKSQGLGDLQLVGNYTFLEDNQKSVSALVGVKFPTGSIREENSVGTRFEPELQPGSGSYDYLLGGVYRKPMGRWSWVTNSVYVFKTEGRQDFEFGDVFSTALLVDYTLNPSGKMPTKLGLDTNIQFEQKQKDHGAKVLDSGGTTWFLGPMVTVKANENMTLSGSFLAPVYQNLGGVHQEIDFVWTLEGKVVW